MRRDDVQSRSRPRRVLLVAVPDPSLATLPLASRRVDRSHGGSEPHRGSDRAAVHGLERASSLCLESKFGTASSSSCRWSYCCLRRPPF